jgi:hypothetical protein
MVITRLLATAVDRPPDRTPDELVFLADLTVEPRAWPSDTWAKSGSTRRRSSPTPPPAAAAPDRTVWTARTVLADSGRPLSLAAAAELRVEGVQRLHIQPPDRDASRAGMMRWSIWRR